MIKRTLITLSAVAFAILLIPAAHAHASISFNASSSRVFSATTTATTSITVGSGSNEMLVIGISASGTVATNVTVGGTAANKAIEASSSKQDAEIWYYANLSSGTYTVSSSFGASASGTLIVASYFGVAKSPTLDATSSASSTSSKTPSSTITAKTPNDWVMDMVAFPGGDTYSSMGSGQTLVNTTGTSYERGAASYKSLVNAGATTTSWTVTSSAVAWEEVQAAFLQANPSPTITSISPNSTTTGAAQFTLTVTGTNFVQSSTVYWNGTSTALATTYSSSTQITATVPSSDLTTATSVPVYVINPAPGGGTSASSTFTVNNPVPTITSITPTSTNVNSSGFTLTVTGTNFVSNSVVDWNGTALSTVYSSSTQITATVPASPELTTAGNVTITVANPSPGGGTSGSATFDVIGTGYTWTDWAGDGNWNTAGNWSGGMVPGAGNVAVFSASSSANCAINGTISVGGINITSGYTGTITQPSGDAVTVGGSGWSQAGGTFTGSSGGDSIFINGPFSQTGGTFKSTTGYIDIMGSSTFSGTFQNNSGTVAFGNSGLAGDSGSGVTSTITGSTTFNNLIFGANSNGYGNASSIYTIATGTTLTADGYFYQDTDYASIQYLGGGVISLLGNIEAGGYYPEYATSTASIVLSGTGTQIVGDGTVSQDGSGLSLILPNLTITKTSGSVTLVGNIDIMGSFTNTNGTTMSPGTSTVAFGMSQILTPLGNFDPLLAATITGTSTFNNLIFGADDNGGTYYPVGQYTIATGTTLTADGYLYLDTDYSEVQLFGGGTIDVLGNINPSWDQTFTSTSTANIVLTGTSTQLIGNNSGAEVLLPDLTVQKSSGVAYFEGISRITGAVTVSQGELQLATSTASSSVEVDGALTVNSGARLSDYPAATSTIYLSSVTNNGVVWFDGGDETKCSSPFPQYVSIESTTTGQQVPWSGSGYFIIRYANIQDQGGSTPITVMNGTNNGDNSSYWTFNTGPEIYLVQSTTVSSPTPGDLLTYTFPFAPRAGDLIVVPVLTNVGNSSISDSANDSWDLLEGTSLPNGTYLGVYVDSDTQTTSTYSITLSSGSPAQASFAAFDYTDADETSTTGVFDGQGGAVDFSGSSNGFGSPVEDGPMSGSTNNELYFAYFTPMVSATVTASTTGGWTPEASADGMGLYTEDLSTSTQLSSAYATWTDNATSGDEWVGFYNGFLPASLSQSGYVASGTLDSATFDTKAINGAELNSVTWYGTEPIGTNVEFQFATSSSPNGPWNFVGPDGTSGTYFPNSGNSTPGTAIPLVSNIGGSGYAMFAARYFRYRIVLVASSNEIYTPTVTGVTVNWSP